MRAVTGHKTFAIFLRYNKSSDDDVRAVVLAHTPGKMVG